MRLAEGQTNTRIYVMKDVDREQSERWQGQRERLCVCVRDVRNETSGYGGRYSRAHYRV